eukprot:scaffold3362_cov402-Prasinococcus_capsulatus_cf.AAC.3
MTLLMVTTRRGPESRVSSAAREGPPAFTRAGRGVPGARSRARRPRARALPRTIRSAEEQQPAA